MHPYDPRHFRFTRSLDDTPVIERYDPPRLRWGLAVAVVAVALLASVVQLVQLFVS